jgi:general secretion pathway protein I
MTQRLYDSMTHDSMTLRLNDSKTRIRGREGFTLIEIVVALAILSIGVTVIMELFAGGLRSARVSEDYTKATWHGQAKMEEMLMIRDLSEGVTEGTFDDQFSWKSEVKKDTPSLGQDENTGASPPVDVYQIVVTVTWPSGTGKRSLELESLRAYKSEEGVSGKL